MSAMPASRPRRLTQADVDLICARHDRLWSGRGGGARAVFSFADLSGLTLGGKNLSGARLRQADLSLTVMNRASFAGGDLRDVNAYGAVFGGASFAGANLTNATFVGAYLQGTNFRGATLTGVNLSGAEMDRATGLSQGQLNQACGDGSTSLPRGLSVPRCR